MRIQNWLYLTCWTHVLRGGLMMLKVSSAQRSQFLQRTHRCVIAVDVLLKHCNLIDCFAVDWPHVIYTRGVQKVCRLAQLTTRYAHYILSLSNINTCNWNALGPAFLESCDPVVEELLFLVFQPAICHSDNVLVVKKLCVFMNSFSLGKNRSHLEPGQRIWS